MSAGLYDIHLDAGATYRLILTYRSPEGEVLSLVDYSASMEVREAPRSPLVLALSSEGDNPLIEFTDPENGELTITIPADVTQTLPEGRYRYDLLIRSPSDFVTRVVQGSFTVIPGITGFGAEE